MTSLRTSAVHASSRRGARVALLLVAAGLSSASAWAGGADRLSFAPAEGAKTHKVFRASHELRIDNTGVIHGDLPFVSDGTAGWISSSERLEFLDTYVRVGEGRPLEFTRQIRDCTIAAKANITRTNGQILTEQAPGASPLRRHKLRFTWVERLSDWTRCFIEIDGDEHWLDSLRGDFELTALLPTKEVAPGEQWSIAPEALRAVLAPGGNHKITPQTDKLFGRLVELGVGGDFADGLGPELLGSVTATYRGRKQVSEGEGDAALKFEVAEIEYEINLASTVDRKFLYVSAMPEAERREPARIDGVPLEFTFLGRATLLWDVKAARAHSLEISGNEAYVSTVSKTIFDGRNSMPVQQIGRYSGPLKIEITFRDGANVSDTIEAPKRGKNSGQKR